MPQIKARLKDLNKADLRKVRTYEKNNSARKGLLDDLDRRIDGTKKASSTPQVRVGPQGAPRPKKS